MSCIKQIIRGSFDGSAGEKTISFNATIDPAKSLIFVSCSLYYIDGGGNGFKNPLVSSLNSTSFVYHGGYFYNGLVYTLLPCNYQIIEFT